MEGSSGMKNISSVHNSRSRHADRGKLVMPLGRRRYSRYAAANVHAEIQTGGMRGKKTENAGKRCPHG